VTVEPLRNHARFRAPPPAGWDPELPLEDVRARLLRSEGPAELALELHAGLRARAEGVAAEVDGLTAVGGSFLVRRGRGGVRVLLLWTGPPELLWLVSIWPLRTHRRRRREHDLGLARDLQPHLDALLRDHADVSDVVWMTDDEAEAYPL
jgi:hypothetical protein